jgi:hypothetical protein
MLLESKLLNSGVDLESTSLSFRLHSSVHSTHPCSSDLDDFLTFHWGHVDAQGYTTAVCWKLNKSQLNNNTVTTTQSKESPKAQKLSNTPSQFRIRGVTQAVRNFRFLFLHRLEGSRHNALTYIDPTLTSNSIGFHQLQRFQR